MDDGSPDAEFRDDRHADTPRTDPVLEAAVGPKRDLRKFIRSHADAPALATRRHRGGARMDGEEAKGPMSLDAWNTLADLVVKLFAIIGGVYACAGLLGKWRSGRRAHRLSAGAQALLNEIRIGPAPRMLTVVDNHHGIGFYVPRLWNGPQDGAQPPDTPQNAATQIAVAELVEKGRIVPLCDRGMLRQYRLIE